MKNIFIFLYVFLAGSACLAQDGLIINVYVHGTQQFGSKLLPKDIWYCPQGLHHLTKLPAPSMMLQDAKLLEQGDPHNFNLKHYYTFGWSGKLSAKKRAVAGQQLYDELFDLIQSYQKIYGQLPKVRLISFSHGGNVVLNMVKHLPFIEEAAVDLELVLIACPVQKTTQDFINHDAISRSYVIYSTFDLLQIVDVYWHKGIASFSGRTFDAINENCVQTLVSVNQSALSHTELCHAFMRHVPKVLDNAKNQSSHFLKLDIFDPGFVHYNGLNFVQVLQSGRKYKEHVLSYSSNK